MNTFSYVFLKVSVLLAVSLTFSALPTYAQTPMDLDLNGDWTISHEELLRAVEIWKAGSYYQDTTGRYLPGKSPGWIASATITIPLLGLPTGAKPLEMVYIPAGTFTMGQPENEPDYQAINGPPHQVTLTQGFYLGKYEITQAQWQAVMGSNPSYLTRGDNKPVQYFTWSECQEFIENLNQLGQGTFRLPTEAEWEYACRVGTTTRFYWGDDLQYSQVGQYAWYPYYGSSNESQDVGLKLPNAWGLFDMSGNIFELCQDWHGDYSALAQINPTGPTSGTYKVIRGGSIFNGVDEQRSYSRIRGSDPYKRDQSVGFRLVKSS